MVQYDSPGAIWAGILGTLAMSFLGIERGTQDRFTGEDGDALKSEIVEVAEKADKIEHLVEIYSTIGPKEIRNNIKRMEDRQLMFLAAESSVRDQHDELERLVREILKRQHDSHNVHGDRAVGNDP